MNSEILEATKEQYKKFCEDIGLTGHENCEQSHLFLVINNVCKMHALDGHFAEQQIFDMKNKNERLGKQAVIYRSAHHHTGQ